MKKVIFLMYVLITTTVSAQKLSIGVEGGASVTKLLITTKYSNQTATKYSPWLGYYIGVSGKYKLSDKSAIKFFVQGEKRSVRTVNGIQYTDANGNPLNEINFIISNNYVNVGALYVMTLAKYLQLGVGINNHILIYSTSYSSDLKTLSSNGRYKNEYFKKYLASIPVQLIITPNSRFNICYSIDFGVMNRVGNSGGVYKQFEYTMQLGLNYRLSKQ